MVYSDWLAEVRCQIPDTDKALYSTGIAISRRCILTTAHGINEYRCSKIEIRFVNKSEREKGWLDAKVIWLKYDEKIDAALIEFDEVKNLKPIEYCTVLPKLTQSWEGTGFTKAVKSSGNARELIPLNGIYNPAAGRVNDELLLTTSIVPKEIKGLQGISGATVMCDGKLIGIIKSSITLFQGSLLRATSIKQLFNINEFKRTVEKFCRKDLIELYKDRLEKWRFNSFDKEIIISTIENNIAEIDLDKIKVNESKITNNVSYPQIAYALTNNIEPIKKISEFEFTLVPLPGLEDKITGNRHTYFSSNIIDLDTFIKAVADHSCRQSESGHKKVSLHDIKKLIKSFSDSNDHLVELPELTHLKYALSEKLIHSDVNLKEYAQSEHQNDKDYYICRFFQSQNLDSICVSPTKIMNPGGKIENINIRLELIC